MLYVKLALLLATSGGDHIQNRIKELRTAIPLTQEQLSLRLGVSRQTLISLESGRYHPSLVLAHKLAQVFAVQMEDLFTFEGDENI